MSARTGEGGPVSRRPDWDAGAYHRIATPQQSWGERVLARLALRGDEAVLDAGCGTGRLTARLAGRLPRGRVVALDRSPAMTALARQSLPGRVGVVCADLLAVPFGAAFDVVFSTATFHWVLDPAALDRELARVLVPGGRLHAQCGGGANVARLYGRARAAMREPRWAEHFRGWRDPWLFLSAEEAREFLEGAGFRDVRAWLEEAPTPFQDRAAYREFVASVVLADVLARLAGDAERGAFLDRICDEAAADEPAFTLDYVRLNLEAVRG